MQYISYSSRKGRHLLHICFKVNYCHSIFDDKNIQKRCEEIFRQVELQEHKFTLEQIGFDRKHVHFLAELGPEASESYFAKKLKGMVWAGSEECRDLEWANDKLWTVERTNEKWNDEKVYQ